jgi:hypothetical protein
MRYRSLTEEHDMEVSRHFRDGWNRFQGICGAGYSWPSSVALTWNRDEVTCKACLKKLEEENNGEVRPARV